MAKRKILIVDNEKVADKELEQLAALGDSEPELKASIARFQADEREHRDIALAAGAEATPAYPILYSAIRAGCRIAIELSKRI